MGVGALAVALAIAGYATEVLRQPELDTVDARFGIRGEEQPPRELVVVQIDDLTFGELNEQWPFPRSMHGRLIDRLRRSGAKVVAYDVQFTEPSDDPREDEELIEASRRAGNVVFSTTEVDKDGGSLVLGGAENLSYARARDADTSFELDGGGVVRRVPFALQKLESFAVAAAEEATRKPVDGSEFKDGTAWIDFSGPPGTIKHHSFSRVLAGRVPASEFRDKIVVVGASAPSLQDVHATSTTGREQMSGAELQANAIATVLDGLPLKEAPAALDLLLIALLGLVAPVASLRFSPLRALALALGAGAVFVVLVQLAFNAGLIVALMYPLAALALAIVGSQAVHYLTTAFERQRVRDLFARYVPERVVEEVIDRADGVWLAGEEMECTVMFTDLRGFTTFSEGREPNEVIRILNQYMGEMSEAILGNGGTLVAYLGDGIMAVFGAPIAQDDHADRALATAREMVGPRLERFNDWLREQGLGDGFRMGVGLNTGFVMSGNIGSDKRLEYTIIGDTVNTASRLEGMTKGTPHMIFIADSTRAAMTRDVPDFVHVDELEVRGRLARVSVWSVADADGKA